MDNKDLIFTIKWASLLADESQAPSLAADLRKAQVHAEALISQRDALVESLKSADVQLELAACCIENKLYDEALLHASSMTKTRRKLLNDAEVSK